MTKKRTKTIRDLSNTDLMEKVKALQMELAKEIAVKSSGTRSEKPATIRNTRKAIARNLTILHERKLKQDKESTVKGGKKK